ncbi:putative site-specific recombinase [Bacillus sp. TS-2]|nr:putative site-specific recombinase [Bacillus sp. TS-2]
MAWFYDKVYLDQSTLLTVQGRETTASVTVNSRIWLPKEKHIVVKDTHAAIISEHVFELVQDKIFKVKKHIPKAQTHLYTNYLFCKDCSASMWYRSNRTGYICGRYAKHGKKYCSNHAIKEEIITKAVISDIMQAVELIDNNHVRKELQRNNEVTLEHLSAQRHTLLEKIDKSKALKRSFLRLLAEGTITSDDYQAETQLIDTQLIECNNELEKLSDVMNGLDVEHELRKFQDAYRQFFQDHQLTKKNLPQFINRIEVGVDKVPIITYRFPHLFSLLNQ